MLDSKKCDDLIILKFSPKKGNYYSELCCNAHICA